MPVILGALALGGLLGFVIIRVAARLFYWGA